MKFRVKKLTPRLETVAGPKIDDLFPNEIVSDTGKTDAAFMEIDPGDGKQGWVLQADCEPVSGGVRPQVERGPFVAECIAVERAINDLPAPAPWFTAADFLIARALFETDISNTGPKIAGSDAVGPLQVSSDEWKSFLANAGPLTSNYRLGDYDHPIKQIRAAAYRMHADAVAIGEARANKKVGAAEDLFLPSYLDLFHAYLTDSAKAAVAIVDAEARDGDKSKPIDQVLQGVLSEERIATLFTARSQFMGTPAQPKSVDAFIAGTEATLTEALKKAFALVQQLAPEELPQIPQGEAPWFDFAETQLGIKEPDARILKYWDATDFRPKPTSTDVPWCGAFAAYCLSKSGRAAAAQSVPKGAAAAINWRGWGIGLPLNSPDIPRGAVVVLAPAAGTGSTGHVGFFDKMLDDGRVQLLGGNQSNAVSRTPFPARIVAIRWLDLKPANSKDQFGGKTSALQISDRAFNLIIEFEVTSKQVYEKKYRHPEWPGVSSGVTIGIGYDVGYATKQRLNEDWGNVIPRAMIAALEQAIGVKGAAAKPLAQQLGASVDIAWDAAIKVHRNCVMPRWIGVVAQALPHTDKLSPNQLGALVSLAYNRGPSFSAVGDRYREMNAIKKHMEAEDFARIPEEFRSMKRLWPGIAGLQQRREREAALFEAG